MLIRFHGHRNFPISVELICSLYMSIDHKTAILPLQTTKPVLTLSTATSRTLRKRALAVETILLAIWGIKQLYIYISRDSDMLKVNKKNI